LIGGLVGAILGSPFFPVGPILGTFLGTYTGCVVLEITASKNMHKAHKVSLSATISKVAAFAFKTALSFSIILGVSIIAALNFFSQSN